MVTDPQKAQLEALEARIDAAKQAQAPEPKLEEHYSQAQHAWRMVIELVSGIVLGVAIGLGLDWLFGTRPIFLVIFVLFGLAAGVNVMLRTARELGSKTMAQAEADQEDEHGGR